MQFRPASLPVSKKEIEEGERMNTCEHDELEKRSVCCGAGSAGDTDCCAQCRDHTGFELFCVVCSEEVEVKDV